MSEKNNFDSAVTALFGGMSNFVSTKTVVGDAVHIGDTIILPLVDVSFGMAAGSKLDGSKDSSHGGMGGKMSPSAVLVISNGSSKIINVKSQDSLSKILDIIPDVINKIMKKNDKNELSDEEVLEAAKDSFEKNR